MIDRLANRVLAMNQVNGFLNRYAPLLREHIQNNPYKLKSDGELFKKDKKALHGYLPHRDEHGIQWYLRISPYSGVSLRARIRYKSSQSRHDNHYTWEYFEAEVFVEQTNFKDLPLYDLEEVRAMSAELPELQDQYLKLNSKILAIKSVVFA